MEVTANPMVTKKIRDYPVPIEEKLMFLRQLIMEAASEMEGAVEIEETLKWGEPSYVTKTGSTIRIDWKKKNPDSYAMYFNCRTTLVDTFKEVFPKQFQYEGNRAIVFKEHDEIPAD